MDIWEMTGHFERKKKKLIDTATAIKPYNHHHHHMVEYEIQITMNKTNDESKQIVSSVSWIIEFYS